MADVLVRVDEDLIKRVAEKLGMEEEARAVVVRTALRKFLEGDER